MPKHLPNPGQIIAASKQGFLPPAPQTPQELALYDQAVFSWTAQEYIQHPKSKFWYTAAAIIIASVIVINAFTNNFTMALAVLVLAGVYQYTHSHHPPREIKITVSRMGIKVGKMIFPFSHIQLFWIIHLPPHINTLNLRVKDHFFSDVIIQLNDQDPAELREYLCGQVPEWEGKSERFSDVILRLLKL